MILVAKEEISERETSALSLADSTLMGGPFLAGGPPWASYVVW